MNNFQFADEHIFWMFSLTYIVALYRFDLGIVLRVRSLYVERGSRVTSVTSSLSTIFAFSEISCCVRANMISENNTCRPISEIARYRIGKEGVILQKRIPNQHSIPGIAGICRFSAGRVIG